MQADTLSGERYNVVTEMMLRVLGLDYVAETVVGGPMLRGISGGQKKRVTTGEMIVGCALGLGSSPAATQTFLQNAVRVWLNPVCNNQ